MDWLAEEEDDMIVVKRKPWKVLIIDDDDEVHKVTRMAMKTFNFQGRELDFVSAYSAEDAKELLAEHSDIAVILLDVVMETDDAGLKLVNYIRKECNNTITRIILRTGQPGTAPESEVIRDYDIDGYKAKTEITHEGLNHLFYVALRSYRDICRINNYKDGLKALINAVLRIDKFSNVNDFSAHLLQYLCEVLDAYQAELVINDKKPVIINIRNAEDQVLRSHSQHSNESITRKLIDSSLSTQSTQTEENYTAIYHKSTNNIESVIVIEADSELDNNAIDLIHVFAEHVSILIRKV